MEQLEQVAAPPVSAPLQPQAPPQAQEQPQAQAEARPQANAALQPPTEQPLAPVQPQAQAQMQNPMQGQPQMQTQAPMQAQAPMQIQAPMQTPMQQQPPMQSQMQQQPSMQMQQQPPMQMQAQPQMQNPMQQQYVAGYGAFPAGPMVVTGAPVEKATHLLAACESCLAVTRIPGFDMSFRRIMESKCPRCGGNLVLPQEVMEMLILYGNFVTEPVAVTVLLGTMALHPSLRPDFVASAMNELLIPLQSDFVYDVAVPKRPEGLGMSLRMHRAFFAVSF